MKKLKEIIRKPDFKPDPYGGFLVDDFQFQKYFFQENKTLETVFSEINDFLDNNGYSILDFESFQKDLFVEQDEISVSDSPFNPEDTKYLTLTIKRFDPWNNPVDRVLVELIKFRNERDWQKFHNSKDLALALNIESSELLELFLWKGNEDANPEKLKEELADIFLYGLLILEKHGLDFEEILMEKIRINGEKYPASKAKGTSKKYNEL